METMTQKKFSININQKEFLANYKKWGFSDQSSIVREALDRFTNELVSDYTDDKKLTVFTDLDGEDFV